MVRLGDAVMPCVSEDISMNGLSVATDGTVREDAGSNTEGCTHVFLSRLMAL